MLLSKLARLLLAVGFRQGSEVRTDTVTKPEPREYSLIRA